MDDSVGGETINDSVDDDISDHSASEDVTVVMILWVTQSVMIL
jgi:hypothetical protein